MHLARCLSRRIEKGKAYGQITAKAIAVLEALLWGFHNARSGLCFPSYETIAEAAGCARSTVHDGVTTRSVKNRTLSQNSNEISRVKNKALSHRGGVLGTRHRKFLFQPSATPPPRAARTSPPC